jgi:hypothetical protein
MFSSSKKENTITLGFYNVENLFDTKNNPKTLDDDFTEDGKKKWDKKRYKQKIKIRISNSSIRYTQI